MASSGKLNLEMELKSPADKFWNAIRDSPTIFPKAFPNQYKSIEVVEGDGKSVGSIRLVHFAQGTSAITSSEEKIESVDEANKALSYSVIAGDLLKYYKNFKASLAVTPKGDGCVVKWTCEFEKASEDVPNPDIMKDFAIKNFEGLDAYLLKP